MQRKLRQRQRRAIARPPERELSLADLVNQLLLLLLLLTMSVDKVRGR